MPVIFARKFFVLFLVSFFLASFVFAQDTNYGEGEVRASDGAEEKAYVPVPERAQEGGGLFAKPENTAAQCPEIAPVSEQMGMECIKNGGRLEKVVSGECVTGYRCAQGTGITIPNLEQYLSCPLIRAPSQQEVSDCNAKGGSLQKAYSGRCASGYYCAAGSESSEGGAPAGSGGGASGGAVQSACKDMSMEKDRAYRNCQGNGMGIDAVIGSDGCVAGYNCATGAAQQNVVSAPQPEPTQNTYARPISTCVMNAGQMKELNAYEKMYAEAKDEETKSRMMEKMRAMKQEITNEMERCRNSVAAAPSKLAAQPAMNANPELASLLETYYKGDYKECPDMSETKARVYKECREKGLQLDARGDGSCVTEYYCTQNASVPKEAYLLREYYRSEPSGVLVQLNKPETAEQAPEPRPTTPVAVPVSSGGSSASSLSVTLYLNPDENCVVTQEWIQKAKGYAAKYSEAQNSGDKETENSLKEKFMAISEEAAKARGRCKEIRIVSESGEATTVRRASDGGWEVKPANARQAISGIARETGDGKTVSTAARAIAIERRSYCEELGQWQNKRMKYEDMAASEERTKEASLDKERIARIFDELDSGIAKLKDRCAAEKEGTKIEEKAPVPLETAIGQPTVEKGEVLGYIAYLYGKVNKIKKVGGEWISDSDRVSGADLDRVEYCKKWFAQSEGVREVGKEFIRGWINRNGIADSEGRASYDEPGVVYACLPYNAYEVKSRLAPELPEEYEMMKPVAPEKTQEISDYYREKMTGIMQKNENLEGQLKSLKELRNEIDSLIGELLQRKGKADAAEIGQLVEKIEITPGKFKAGEVEVEALDKIVSGKIQNRKAIEVQARKKSVVLKEGALEVEASGITLSENGLNLGGADVTVSPVEAANKVSAAPKRMRMMEENDRPVYKVDTEREGKILGIIPIKISRTSTVDAQSGEITKEESPWWSAIAKEEQGPGAGGSGAAKTGIIITGDREVGKEGAGTAEAGIIIQNG